MKKFKEFFKNKKIKWKSIIKNLIILFLNFTVDEHVPDKLNNLSKEYQMKINYSREIETDNLKEKTNINFEIEFSSKN